MRSNGRADVTDRVTSDCGRLGDFNFRDNLQLAMWTYSDTGGFPLVGRENEEVAFCLSVSGVLVGRRRGVGGRECVCVDF